MTAPIKAEGQDATAVCERLDLILNELKALRNEVTALKVAAVNTGNKLESLTRKPT